jgi:hypothetical protein
MGTVHESRGRGISSVGILEATRIEENFAEKYTA